ASTGSTSKNRPKTAFMARSDVATPPLVRRKSRRLSPSLGARRPAAARIRFSTARCAAVWGNGGNSSLETSRVGSGTSVRRPRRMSGRMRKAREFSWVMMGSSGRVYTPRGRDDPPGGAMDITHRTVHTNGIHMHVAEAGRGPLVVLCHGFPESWYSWRHQLVALAEAGFHAVAPDQRGYGQTDKPEAIESYTLLHLVGDIVGLLDALGAPTAVIAGHDWGRAGRVARGAAAARSLPRCDRPQRAVLSARLRAPHHGDARDPECDLLPALLPGARRRGEGARARTARHDPSRAVLGIGGCSPPADRR